MSVEHPSSSPQDSPYRGHPGHPAPGDPRRSSVPGQSPAPGRQDAAPPRPAGSGSPGDAPAGEGRVVGGRYRLLERLGHGGMGTVWRAVDDVVRREVAIKEPRVPDHVSDALRAQAYERMLREARSAANVDHPSVVRVFDLVMEGDRPWIVMELVRGRSLEAELAEGTLEPQRAATIALPVLDALAAVHEANILHRDVKPANVLLGPYDRVILTDFGIARIEGEQALTESGALIGSPEFISPERVDGVRPGPASDLWSLGMVLYIAVEGWSPFRRVNSPTTMLAVRDDPLPPPRRAGELAPLITALLAKDPRDRPRAPQVREALRAASAERVTVPMAAPPPSGPWSAGPPSAVGPAARPADGASAGRGRRWFLRPWALAAAVAVVAAAVVVPLEFVPHGDPVPDGYTRVTVADLNDVSTVVPQGWKKRKKGTAVTWASPDTRTQLVLMRTAHPSGTPLHDLKTEINNDAHPGPPFRGDDVTNTTTFANQDFHTTDQHGMRAAKSTFNYTLNGYLSRELVVYNDSKVRYWLAVRNSSGSDRAHSAAKKVYDTAVKELKVPSRG